MTTDTADRVASHLRSFDLDGKSWVTGVSINGLLAHGARRASTDRLWFSSDYGRA